MAKGNKTGGRQQGTPNKTTASAKEALTLTFEGVGGVPKLVEWAEANLTEFYKLWAKLLPKELNNKMEVEERPRTLTPTPQDDEILARYYAENKDKYS